MGESEQQQVHRMVTAVIEHIKVNEEDAKIEWTPTAKLALTKLLMVQASTLGSDIEAFAKHAKRSTVQPDDIKLALRRNPHLVEQMDSVMAGSLTKKASKKAKTDAAAENKN